MKKCNCEKCKKESNHLTPPEYEICYYKCKDSCNKKDCHHLVEKTEHLIDSIECKNKHVIESLTHAKAEFPKTNLEQPISDLKTAKTELGDFDKTLNAIAVALIGIANQLKNLPIPATTEVTAALNTLENIVGPAQTKIEGFVEDALDKAKCTDKLIDDLECSFDKTVNCLKESCDNKPLVLVPCEDDCKCKPKNECGCKG